MDYKLWSVIQEQVYMVKINNVDELRQPLQTAWDELAQWCTHLRACIVAKGGHFEHKL